ncbi:outer membrane protein assembly factor BamE [Sphingobacterium faecium]|uniref:outer membrane protein assembly factor BamE n=2 Tax=Sphingobacterium faecium TaxID=34087 RepID=UPI0021B5C9AD|nr:outer membrane protein assembly factor BamE [Sphingobacterium faecium]UXD70213.1 outer membrane protein assembly factor BamE [Sphingobacterium faecium]
MKKNLITIIGLLAVILSSCSGVRIATMRQSKMEQLELGMSKSQVVNILGSSYSIAQKEINNTDTIEVIS